jgi:hypothetical protein
MTGDRVSVCLNKLKIKNCKGYGRIPKRILKDGASILINVLLALFGRIYMKRKFQNSGKWQRLYLCTRRETSMRWQTTDPSQTSVWSQKFLRN